MNKESSQCPILKRMVPFSVRVPWGENVLDKVVTHVAAIHGVDGFVRITDQFRLPSKELVVTGFAFQGIIENTHAKIEP